MHDKLCFVQFLHPGGEHHLAAPGIKAWTRVEDGHGRKFLRTSGRSLESLDARPADGELGFWGEWEAPSQAEPVSTRVADGPLWIHCPFWSHQASYRGLHNTDPFVFGDRFHYTGCLQHTKHGPTQLRNLSRGSVILFGSKRPGRPDFTLDTVFVVADYVDHTRRDYKRKLAGVVSETYAAVTLAPWYGETAGCKPPESNGGCNTPESERSFRLYLGATFEDPVDGMFSFFPCVTGHSIAQGFARPAIRIPDVITPTMTQNKRLNPRQSTDEITPLWNEVVRQVIAQGLALGIHADLPTNINATRRTEALEPVLPSSTSRM
jgi:hypothetical protein